LTGRAEPFELRFEGRAKVGDAEVVHDAVPADDCMQAFAYRHWVPAQSFQVAVGEAGRSRPRVRVLDAGPLRIQPGGEASVRLGALARGLADRLRFELKDPPAGLTLAGVRASREGLELRFLCDADQVERGLAGNLIVEALASGGGAAGAGKGRPQGPARRTVLDTLPAIAFEVAADPVRP
jgi:hypothetical protein